MEEKDIKQTAKTTLLDLGVNVKLINKYLDKIFIKNHNIDVNTLVKLVYKQAILDDMNYEEEIDSLDKIDKSGFYKIDKDNNESKYESLKKDRFIKL